MSINYFSFDGSTSALDLGSLTFAADFTIAFRLNPTTYSGSSFEIPFASQSTGGGGSFVQIFCDFPAAGNLSWDPNTNGTDGYSGSLGALTTFLPTGTDAFVAIVRTGGLAKLFINGSLVNTQTLSAPGAVTLTAMRLAVRWTGTTYNGWLACEMSQFGAWDLAWTSPDIANHASGNDPTSIEWANAVEYVPLQTATPLDIFGATVAKVGSPGFVGTASTISVSPSSVAPSSTTTITVTGTNTPWIVGSAPVLVSAGSNTSDAVSTATSRTFSYTAPGSGSSVTITDPSTGATVSLSLGVSALSPAAMLMCA